MVITAETHNTDDVKPLRQRRSTLPRIVSAAVKQNSIPTIDDHHLRSRELNIRPVIIKPYVAGELEMINGCCRSRRFAEIREGCLLLYKTENGRKVFDFRILLRNLNLRIDPNCLDRFSLSKRGELSPLATFQVPDGQDNCRWLKNLAIQIISNTSLKAVKFLDVLDILEEFKKQQQQCQQQRVDNASDSGSSVAFKMKTRRFLIPSSSSSGDQRTTRFKKIIDINNNNVDDNYSKVFNSDRWNKQAPSYRAQYQHPTVIASYPAPDLTRHAAATMTTGSFTDLHRKHYVRTAGLPDVVNDVILQTSSSYATFSSMPATVSTKYAADDSGRSLSVSYGSGRDHLLIDLLTRCQTNDQYVSVSEKRLLFESLSRFSYSVDNLIHRNSNADDRSVTSTIVTSKYHSLHDLNSVNVTSVKNMCRYFEKSAASTTPPSPWIPEQTV